MTGQRDECCGTCGWSEPCNRPKCVDCDWIFHHPTPIALNYNQTYMRVTEGINCPCWKPKEATPAPTVPEGADAG